MVTWHGYLKIQIIIPKDPKKVLFLNYHVDLHAGMSYGASRIKFLDIGCSRHMKWDMSMFIDIVHKERDYINYGDNNWGKLLGEVIMGNPSIIMIYGVLLVKALKHNLLSNSQLWDKGYIITFDTLSYPIDPKANNEIVRVSILRFIISICLTYMMYQVVVPNV